MFGIGLAGGVNSMETASGAVAETSAEAVEFGVDGWFSPESGGVASPQPPSSGKTRQIAVRNAVRMGVMTGAQD